MKVIGLMSGTSVDGIDAALVEIKGKNLDIQVSVLDTGFFPYPAPLQSQILAVSSGKPLSMAALAALDEAIASSFASAALNLAKNNPDVALIGSHGQTVYHSPQKEQKLGYSLQLGRGASIAHLTGIPTVSDFRAADIAAGGQGAPLVPKVDAALLADTEETRCIQNLGGIANVTYLPPKKNPNWEKSIIGWDTGPGNILLDLAVKQLTQGKQHFDKNGEWASLGKPCTSLVNQWIADNPFFSQPPPKSTGRELFGLAYLSHCYSDGQKAGLSSADWLATLTELTVATIVINYQLFLPKMPSSVLLCGGGSYNLYLKKRLQATLGEEITVCSTDSLGISAKYKEAIAFAVLAYWRWENKYPGNLLRVTGALQEMLLGSMNQTVNTKIENLTQENLTKGAKS